VPRKEGLQRNNYCVKLKCTFLFGKSMSYVCGYRYLVQMPVCNSCCSGKREAENRLKLYSKNNGIIRCHNCGRYVFSQVSSIFDRRDRLKKSRERNFCVRCTLQMVVTRSCRLGKPDTTKPFKYRYEYVCTYCGETYTRLSKRLNTKYCSNQCHADYRRFKTGVYNLSVKCLECGNEIVEQKSSHKIVRKYCSMTCYGKMMTKEWIRKRKSLHDNFTCKWCGKTKRVAPYQARTQKFCSKKCMGLSRRGREWRNNSKKPTSKKDTAFAKKLIANG
jgi:hypothetical protein